jgi:hypothetical protein
MASIKRHEVLAAVKAKYPDEDLMIKVVSKHLRIDIINKATNEIYFSWSMALEEHVEEQKWIHKRSPTQVVIDSFEKQYDKTILDDINLLLSVPTVTDI